ncbi:hypothetical protein BS78_03G065100 [Paspalum vaginatum]|nr:hypothetical protein BS78_03G065100 [Paspalum vaginatum]
MARSQWAQLQWPDRPPPRPSLAESADRDAKPAARTPKPPPGSRRQASGPARADPAAPPLSSDSAAAVSLSSSSYSGDPSSATKAGDEEILNPNRDGFIYNFAGEGGLRTIRADLRLFLPTLPFFA